MDIKEKLKRIITEWAEYDPGKIYARQFDATCLKGPEILSIIGARRTGKTYLCHQIIRELKKTNPPQNLAYINLEDERLHPLTGEELTLFWETYLELYPVDWKRRIWIFVDEIQNAENWPKWARRITEQHPNVKLVITGSSSKLLSKEIATELRGRSVSVTVYPFSFQEYLQAKNHPFGGKDMLYSSKKRASLKRQFNLYLKEGGFPATLLHPQPQELLKEYYHVMFYRDLAERFKIKNIRLLEDYLTLSLDQVACHFSVSSTAEKLKSFGYSLSKNTLSNFSRYAEDVFLIFTVKKYSYRLKEQTRATRKLYAIDQGLVQAVRFSFSEDYGRMLENIVYLALRRKGVKIYYHQGEKECDFICTDKERVSRAIQVCKTLRNEDTKTREIAGLLEAMNQYRLKEGFILTEDEVETIQVERKTIQVLPVWYWLLNSN